MLFQRSEMQRSKGVPDCSLCDILLISWNPFNHFFPYCCSQTWHSTYFGDKKSVYLGVTVYPIMLLFSVQHILKMLLKSVYKFFCNVVSKYGPRKYKNQDYSLSHFRPVLNISWKSIYPFFCNVANRHGFPRKNRKRNHVCKGFNRTSPKSSRLFLVPSLTYPATFMKSVHAFSCDMTNRQTNQQIWKKHNLCL